MNGSAELAAPTPLPCSDRHCDDQIVKVGFSGTILSLNNEAGNEIAISMPPTTAAEDVHPQFNEHHTVKVGLIGILSPNTKGGKQMANPVAVAEDAAAEAATTQAEDDHPPKENPDHQSMYKAATIGDWAAAEILLSKDKDLGWREITEEGDRALHLAVSRKHTEFVKKLIDLVGWEMLELYDGNGYTACCYAVMAGDLQLVRIMMEANAFIANVQNSYGATPLALAISYANAEIVKCFLSATTIEGLGEEQCFNVLIVAIASKMFDVALLTLENKGNLAVLQGKDDHRTALHVLAQQDISSAGLETRDDRKTRDDAHLLAEKLWQNIQNLGTTRVLDLMITPPILHDAAKAGNLYLIDMIANDYPHLLSHIDQDGYSLSHIILMHRQRHMLKVVKNARNVKNFNAISLDKDGNNLLHSAAKSLYPVGLESVANQDIEMQSAFTWFKAAEEVVPRFYGKMANKNGYTPIELFWKEHAKLLSKIESYVKKTAESGMLISTIVLTLVFAAAFAPPGGFNQETGIPILLKNKWFKGFIVFKILALCSSTYSIIGFWSIISSKTGGYQYLVLPHYLRLSMSALLLSVLFVISAFMSAFFLVFVHERKTLALSLVLPLYVLFVVVIFYQILKVLWKTNHTQTQMEPSMSMFSSLWRRVYHFGASIFSFVCSCFSNS